MWSIGDSLCLYDRTSALWLRGLLCFLSGKPVYFYSGYDEEMNVEYWLSTIQY